MSQFVTAALAASWLATVGGSKIAAKAARHVERRSPRRLREAVRTHPARQARTGGGRRTRCGRTRPRVRVRGGRRPSRLPAPTRPAATKCGRACAYQRAPALLVEAGFRPVEAIRIATSSAATYMGVATHTGTIAPGKNADLVLMKGNPSTDITAIENVETVFKDGTGYDQKLPEAAKGRYGQY